MGETPILHHRLTHDHLSVIGAIGCRAVTTDTTKGSCNESLDESFDELLDERLYFQVHEHAIRSEEVVGFLRHLLRHIPGKLLVVWDGAPIHRGKVVKQFLVAGAARRIHLEQFPGYAPETDPQEGIWRHLKYVELANVCCDDLAEERGELRGACQRLRQKPRIIHSCLVHAGLI